MNAPHKVVDAPPAPGTPEWLRTISASKIPAILGVSRFTSPFAMWHEMAGNVQHEQKGKDRMAWGHAAELALADWWVRRQPEKWQLNAGEVAYKRNDLPFPNLATIDRRARRGRRFRILECKTARDLSDWGKPGEPDSVPADYHAQVIWQMGVSGIHEASIIVLGPFHQAEEHEIPWDAELFAGLVDAAEAWWKTLMDGTPPPLDDSIATYEAVRGLHPDIDPDLTIQIEPKMASEILDALKAEKVATVTARAAKTRLLDAMGSARYACVGETTIATRATLRGSVALRPNLKAEF